MTLNCSGFVAALAVSLAATHAHGGFLGFAESFGVLGGSTVTNTGPSLIYGDLGLWPGTDITGFPPGIVVGGSTYAGNAFAQQAHNDAATAYGAFASMSFGQDLTGMDLGGMTLTPGVYRFSSSAFLTGALTLNSLGDPNAIFVFQIGSTLITASDASVLNINGADGCNVYWNVGSSATLGTGTAFEGSIIAQASITLNTNANIMDGRALALGGAVTMDSNIIDASGCAVPTPGVAAMLGLSALVGGGRSRRRKS